MSACPRLFPCLLVSVSNLSICIALTYYSGIGIGIGISIGIRIVIYLYLYSIVFFVQKLTGTDGQTGGQAGKPAPPKMEIGKNRLEKKIFGKRNNGKSRSRPWEPGCVNFSNTRNWNLPPKVVFHQRSYSTKGHLPPNVIFHRKLSSTKGCLQPKVVFNQRSSSTKGRHPTKVVFHRRLSSTKGSLPPTITPWFIFILWEQSIYQISASYLQFMMHDAWCMMHNVTP